MVLFYPDPAVHLPAAIAWSTWEGATVTLIEDDDMLSSASDPLAAPAVARLESHYFSYGGWLLPDQLIGQAAAALQPSRLPRERVGLQDDQRCSAGRSCDDRRAHQQPDVRRL